MKGTLKRNLKKYTFLAALLCMVFAFGIPSQAASSKMKKLETGRTYKVKLTGKGKQKLRFENTKVTGNLLQGCELTIYINDKKAGTLPGGSGDPSYTMWEIYLCRIAPKRNVLYIRDKLDNDCCSYMKILEYDQDKKKLVELGDLVQLSRSEIRADNDKLLSPWARGHLASVEENRLTISWSDTDTAIGIFQVFVPYDITGSAVKQAGTSYKLIDDPHFVTTKWTSRVNITAYTKAGGKTVSFRIPRGSKVRGLKIRKKNGVLYFKVKNAAGKTGWISDLTRYNGTMGWGDEDGFFEESHFAG